MEKGDRAMRDFFERPEIIKEAAATSREKNLVIEILIYLLVFLVASVAQIIVLIPIFLVLLIRTPEFIALIQTIKVDSMPSVETINDMVQTMMGALTGDMLLVILFATSAMIAAVIIYCRLIEKRKLRTLGLVKKGAVGEYFVGYLVGIVLICVIIGLCLVTGALEFNGLSQNIAVGTLALFFVGYLIQGMSEELLCRGYLMVSVARRYSLPVAIITNSLVFAALHLANPGISVIAMVNLVLFGVLASIYMIKRGSIWGVGAMHSAWNFVLGNVFGIEVSGTIPSQSIFSVTITQKGLGGGAFGLEEGFGTTIIMFIAIITVSLIGNKKNQGEALPDMR